MIRQKWSVNGLATELVVDRRTIARHLEEVEPAGRGPNGNLYWLSEVVAALHSGRFVPSQEDLYDGGALNLCRYILDRVEKSRAREKLGPGAVRCLQEVLGEEIYALLAREDPDGRYRIDCSKMTDAALDGFLQEILDGASVDELHELARRRSNGVSRNGNGRHRSRKRGDRREERGEEEHRTDA